MGTSDWVAIGSYLSVAFMVVMMIYLGVMAYKKIYKDGDK